MSPRKKVVDEAIDEVKSAAKKTSKKVSKAVDGVKDTVDALAEEGEKVVKKTARRAKKATLKPELFIQFNGKQISQEDLTAKVYSKLEGNVDLLKVKNLEMYYNIDENKVYAVVNGTDTVVVDID
ncbi:MAG: DUF6465 family protein [Clostridiaceae bacterium]